MKATSSVLTNKSRYQPGFTLVESLVSVLLLCVLTLASVSMVAAFARHTNLDRVNSCLLQAASSGIEEKRANPVTNAITVSCSGYSVNVAITTEGSLPSPAPAMGSGVSACVPVLARSTIGLKSLELRDSICNFPSE
jgi:prepilin-type N-terminal cleavage/methylation domain-containing protein